MGRSPLYLPLYPILLTAPMRALRPNVSVGASERERSRYTEHGDVISFQPWFENPQDSLLRPHPYLYRYLITLHELEKSAVNILSSSAESYQELSPTLDIPCFSRRYLERSRKIAAIAGFSEENILNILKGYLRPLIKYNVIKPLPQGTMTICMKLTIVPTSVKKSTYIQRTYTLLWWNDTDTSDVDSIDEDL